MELNKRGIPFEIFSLKLCEDRRFQPGAQDLMFSCTHYAPTPWSPKLLFASIGRLFRTPGRYLSTLALALHARKGPFSVFLKTLFVFYQAAWFAKKAEELGLRHVHAHWASIPSSAGLFIARLAGASFSLTAHAYDIYIDRTLLEEKIEAAQYLITCTQYNKRYMLDLYPHVDEHKIQVFYHGVDLNAFDEGGERAETKQEEVPILLSIGRLCDTKGFPDLLTACAVLKSRGLRFRCRIVGDGYMRRDLALEISLMELGDCVEIVGLIPREQVIQEMRQARLFVLPCVVTPRGDRDGLPNVVVEAMSMGLPVITTNISALPEGVEDGVNGRLVPEKNPGALADAIAGCWEDAETLRKWGENSRRKAHEVFGLQENAEALAQFIKGQSV